MPDEASESRLRVGALKFFPQTSPADPQIHEKVLSLWKAGSSFIILSGAPGVGKTRAAEDFVVELLRVTEAPHSAEACRLTNLFPGFRSMLIANQEIETTLRAANIQFVWDIAVLHQQYTYEDLIRGYRISGNATDIPRLEVREGLLGFTARVSQILDIILPQPPFPRSVLILDEINRAPIGQLFGEALYALDRRGASVSTPYQLGSIGSDLIIPPSLLLLGTMNSVDRAVAGFDFALRRRFAFVNMVSRIDAIRLRYKDLQTVLAVVEPLYQSVNKLIRGARQSGIVPLAELVLGHAYFIAPPSARTEQDAIEWLSASYQFKIIPTLLDYQEQGLLEFGNEQLQTVVGGNVLKNELSLGEFQATEIVDQLTALGIAT